MRWSAAPQSPYGRGPDEDARCNTSRFREGGAVPADGSAFEGFMLCSDCQTGGRESGNRAPLRALPARPLDGQNLDREMQLLPRKRMVQIGSDRARDELLRLPRGLGQPNHL